MFKKAVIIADGEFPVHRIPLEELKKSENIICCDGAIKNLDKAGFEPLVIIGDLDSISLANKEKYKNKLIHRSEQDTNDLTKAVNWAIENNFNDIVILGATGKREDHTLGNISLLLEYCQKVKVVMLTNFGVWKPMLLSTTFESYPGQQVSIFSPDNNVSISSVNLKYPLNNYKLNSWWNGTLNESISESFELKFEGRLLVFQEFKNF